MLFDNLADPQQMINLVNKAETSEVQKKLDDMLQNELRKIDDEEIRDREYYLNKFGLEPNREHYTYHYMKVEKVDSPTVN